MLPKYTHTHTHTYIYIYIYIWLSWETKIKKWNCEIFYWFDFYFCCYFIFWSPVVIEIKEMSLKNIGYFTISTKFNWLSENILRKQISNNFWFNATEKPSILNLSCYGSKGYVSVVLNDYKVALLGEGEDVAFCPSLYCVLVIYVVAVSIEAVNYQISLSSILLRLFHWDRQFFSFQFALGQIRTLTSQIIFLLLFVWVNWQLEDNEENKRKITV